MNDKYRLLEITAVIITGVGNYVFKGFPDQQLIFMITAIVFWIVYLMIRLCTVQGIHKYWGISCTNIKPTMKCAGIVGAISIILFIAIGLIFHKTKFSINILFSVLVYPFWGLLQQLLFIGIFAGNLKDFEKIKFNKFLIVAFTSILFAIVHCPDPVLVPATFVMAIIYTIIFLEYRNIIPLGILHGILGTFFYYFVLNRDPWAEMISAICDTVCK